MTQGRTIVDDRGREVQAFEPQAYLAGLDVRSMQFEECELLSKVQLAGVVSNGGGLASGKLSGILVGGVIVLSMTVVRVWLPGVAMWQQILLTGCLVYILFFVLGFFVKDPGRVRTARTLVGNGRCGSCFYPLRDVEQGADGMTQCPECGAAWNARKLRSLVPSSAWSDTTDAEVQLTAGGTLQARLAVIEDDRGRLVFAVDPTLDELKKRFSEHEASEIAMMLGESMWHRNAGNAFMFLVVAIAMASVVVSPGRLGLPPAATPVGVVLFGMWCVMFSIQFFRQIKRARLGTDQENGSKIRHRMLRDGRCATCAAKMDGINPEADGCRVCTCCGSAWRGVGGAEKEKR